MDFFNWEFADAPAADAAQEGNRAHDDVKYGDFDLGQPYDELPGQPSPCPSNAATSESTDSANSGLSDSFDGYQSSWESISLLEGPPPYVDCIWPIEYPSAPFLPTLPLIPPDIWSLDGSLSDFESIDMADISFEDSESIGLGLSFSSNTMIPSVTPPKPSGPATSTPPPQSSAPPESPQLLELNYVPEGDLPACLDQLCSILRNHFPNSKPPGQLFKHFIYRRRDLNHCKLCPKALENREQMNQHVMKVHCDHFPFGCDEPGCTHRAVRMADLIKHKEKHGDPSWNCCYCGNVLRNERNLVRHIKNKHSEMYEPSRPRSRSIRATGTE